MIYEFEGKTEKEAIDRAAEALGLEKDEFDVEIVESQKNGFLFKKGWVKIRVHVEGEERSPLAEKAAAPREAQGRTAEPASRPAERPDRPERQERPAIDHDPASIEKFEADMLAFISTVLEKMDYASQVSVLFREDRKLGIRIESEYSAIIIGKKGKNLDSLQLLANVYAGRIGFEDTRIILDSENYRIRREEALVRLAYATAEKVRASRQSVLLEPMNPFERRLIHTTLNDIGDIETKSEGEGLYKQVRVLLRGRGGY
jgi:spoIIIJ-associated protein